MKAKVQLIIEQPFFATLALRMKYISDPTVKTMQTNGKYIKYNPKFVESISLDETKGVLAHEVMHPAMMHHTRRQGRNPKKWNRACVAPDTMIRMWDGSEKRIDQIEKGDIILGEENGFLKRSIVLATMFKVDNLVEINLHNGYQLHCTDTHRILTESGYKATRECKEEESFAQVVSRSESLCSEQFKNHDDHTNGGSFELELPSGGQLSTTGRAILTTKNNKTCEPAKSILINENRLGVHGRYNRWGGHYFNKQNRERSLSPACDGSQHVNFTSSLVRTFKVLWGFCQKYKWSALLADKHKWVSDFRSTEKGPSLFDNQEGACRVSDSIYSDKAFTILQSNSKSRNAGYLPKDKEIECSRFKTIQRLGKKSIVFDLTTTTHSYIANGIITHNCDYAINPMLVDAKFALPGKFLIDPQFKDMTAEEIYRRLPDLPEDNDPNSSGDPGGCGEVVESDAKTQGEVEEQEAEMKQALSQAATIAKQQGKLPAGMERLIDEVLKPRVPWKEVLQRFLTQIAHSDYTWTKPNRRFIHKRIYLPSLENIETGEIVLIVDTSGSIDRVMLNEFASEMQDIANTFKTGFKIIYVDAEVAAVQDVEADEVLDLKPAGGGGTEFAPGFDWMDEHGVEPSCAVYFTDGFGSCDRKAPDYPVLWAIYGGCDFQAPFGEVLKVRTDE